MPPFERRIDATKPSFPGQSDLGSWQLRIRGLEASIASIITAFWLLRSDYVSVFEPSVNLCVELSTSQTAPPCQLHGAKHPFSIISDSPDAFGPVKPCTKTWPCRLQPRRELTCSVIGREKFTLHNPSAYG
jgi:hypothetical protein